MRAHRLIAPILAAGLAALNPLPAAAELIAGAGSTFAFPVIGKWAQTYRMVKSDGAEMIPVDIGVDYEPSGSAAGEARISQGAVDFGLTDRPVSAAELERSKLLQFPIVMGGVVPAVNIEGVGPGQIRFSGPLLADIYLGKVKTWSDPAIKALNPDLKLPDAAIVVLRRADGSGTTFNFTSYLARVSPEWQATVGADTLVKWPVGRGVEGSQGVTTALLATRNSIGYVELGQVRRASIAFATLQNRAGAFVAPDAASLQAAAATAEWGGVKDFSLMLVDAPGDKAWPIAATVFALVQKEPRSPGLTREALRFFRLSLETGAQDAAALGYVPLPEALVKQVRDYWLRSPLRFGG